MEKRMDLMCDFLGMLYPQEMGAANSEGVPGPACNLPDPTETCS